METEMSENEDVRVEIQLTQRINNNNVVVEEWEDYLRGKESAKRYERKRRIEKVPPLLLKGEKGSSKNREYYEPVLVSLGPYHHNQTDLSQAEKYKLIALEEFCLSTGETINLLYNKVFEVIHDARECYIDGSTDDYNDEEFTRMMLHDSCFILFFIDCLSSANNKMLLSNEYLGALGFANVVRDIFVLENQIPFVVLEVLLELRFPEDKGDNSLNRFFNYLNFGVGITRDAKVLKMEKPLHLLELYRSHFMSLSVLVGSSKSSIWRRWWTKETESNEDYTRKYYVQRTRWFGSVMDLKAKGVLFRGTFDKHYWNEYITFNSHCCYGELKLIRRAVTSNTKAIYLNMIAYELCPHNPTDLKVSTYISIMKTLVVHPDDVKVLQKSKIMTHSLGEDYQVVKMFYDIETPAVNLNMMIQLRRGIQKHCNNRYKTAAAEVIDFYFSSPWKTVASLAATSVLVLTFLQTFFTNHANTPKLS